MHKTSIRNLHGEKYMFQQTYFIYLEYIGKNTKIQLKNYIYDLL